MTFPLPCSRLIWDLDGTLADTSTDLARAMNHALASINRGPLPTAQVRQYVGRGARMLLTQGLATTGGGNPDQVEDLLPVFMDYYMHHIADETRPFDGVITALEQAKQAGIAQAVCTNKPQDLSDRLVAALGLSDFFDVIVGGDALPVRKPDPQHLQTVMDGMSRPGPAILLGDTITDRDAARRIGIPVGLVQFGFSDTDVARMSPDFLLHDMAQLWEFIAPHPAD